jgi:hypothetical protein
MRPFIVPFLIETGEKCSRRIDAGLAGVGQSSTLEREWRRKGDLSGWRVRAVGPT